MVISSVATESRKTAKVIDHELGSAAADVVPAGITIAVTSLMRMVEARAA